MSVCTGTATVFLPALKVWEIGCTSLEGIGCTALEGIGCTSQEGIGCTSLEGIGCTSLEGIGCTSLEGIGCTSLEGIGCTAPEGIFFEGLYLKKKELDALHWRELVEDSKCLEINRDLPISSEGFCFAVFSDFGKDFYAIRIF